ncbi:nuclear factor 7, ovary-like isoform X2 [Rana temporaria]|uniref:nuclear factor 7, ovary-like isoform X2 n=1 Tax=Rana temporaria TaxID=8407 RepID=UPI001AAD3E74|nr:nuclear factor 7, ovary-like isoform X2 [Rana temporaria]
MAAQSPAREPESVEEEEETMEEEEEEEETMEEEFTVQIGSTYSCKRSDGTYHDAEVVKTRMNKRAGREEYYVRYAGLNCRQNEWVDKTRLVLVKQVEEEEDAANEEDEAVDETNQETSENGNEPQKEDEPEKEDDEAEKEEAEPEEEDEPEPEEDEEPQAKKIRVEVHEAPGNSSVVASDDFAEELTCLLCNELFKDPVVVECGHNFCRTCIDEAWEGQESFTCPDCEEEITEKRCTSNRALANLVKKAATTPAKTIVKEKVPPPENCHVHEERLKLFCKDDGDLGCVICRESLKHANHYFLPILDAMGVYKTELSSMVTPLEDALKVAEKMAKQQNEKIDKHRTSMKEYREHIESEFVKMHNVLKEREEKLLGKLQTEGESLLSEMEDNIAKIQENIDNIKESIATASEKMNDGDSISFLTDIKTFIKKCQDEQKEALSPGNTVIEKELSEEAYKVPVLASMFEELKTTVVPAVSSVSAVPQTQFRKKGNRLLKRAALQSGPATTQGTEPKEIWIFGDSMITRAFQLARNRPHGMNLGFEEKFFTVRWFSQTTMEWLHLWPEMSQLTKRLGVPRVVFIHLGSKELPVRNVGKLINFVRSDFRRLTEVYPDTAFIWSPLPSRMSWHGTPTEEKRRMFNKLVKRCAAQCGVRVADLSQLEVMSQYKESVDDGTNRKEDANEVDAFTEAMIDSILAIFNVTNH